MDALDPKFINSGVIAMKHVDKTFVVGAIIYRMIITKTYYISIKSVNYILWDVQDYLKSIGYAITNVFDWNKFSSLTTVRPEISLSGISIIPSLSIEGIMIPAIKEVSSVFFTDIKPEIISKTNNIVLAQLKRELS